MAKETEFEKPSEEFMEAVCTAGSISVDCELCGMTHFASGGDFEEGELEELRLNAEASPGEYMEHLSADSISFGEVNGRQVVDGCPCNKARTYEEFIWNHRHIIKAYIVARAKRQLRAAEDDAVLANRLAGATEET